MINISSFYSLRIISDCIFVSLQHFWDERNELDQPLLRKASLENLVLWLGIMKVTHCLDTALGLILILDLSAKSSRHSYDCTLDLSSSLESPSWAARNDIYSRQ